MSQKKCVGYVLFCLFVAVICDDDITYDYYFGSDPLRMPRSITCYSNDVEVPCNFNCNGRNVCLYNKCYCLDYTEKIGPAKKKKKGPKVQLLSVEQAKNGAFKFIDVYKKPSKLILRQSAPTGRPALRHHIAHFCPNLDDARACIHTCMKVGKPAFCGKDHQCYCGHKYGDPVKDTPVDVDNVYNEFHDLYEKYFGSLNEER